MMTLRVPLSVMFLLSVLITTLAPVSAAYEPAVVDLGETVNSGDPVAWNSDGRTVVWQDRPGNIYAARIGGGERIPVAIEAADDPAVHSRFFPRVSGDVVAWVEQAAEYTRIQTYHLISGQRATVATMHDGRIPTIAIGGEWLAWIGFEAQTTFVMVRNIATMSTPRVLAEQTYLTCPRGCPPPLDSIQITGGRVVWREQVSSAPVHNLRLHHLASGTEESFGAEHFGGFAVAGDIIVLLAPDMTHVAIVDLRSRMYRVLAETAGPGRRFTGALTDGRFVLAYDDANGMYGYDIANDRPTVFPANAGLLLPGGQLVEGRLVFARGNQIRSVAVEELVEGRAWQTHAETGHSVAFDFLRFWEGSGGLMIFGHPLSSVVEEHAVDLPAQYFERQRYEYHLEHAGTPYEVELSRLGDLLLLAQGRQWLTFPKADPSDPHYFEVTGQAIDPRFFSYWSGHGLEFGDPGVTFRESLALFGYPISPVMLETNSDGDTVPTQYFERAVFEWHADNPAPWKVLLRRIGVEVLAGTDLSCMPYCGIE
jgi:hypothetical protein